jgi:sulfotransferase family protein
MGKIVWLASYPKSGNTWLRAFLHGLLTDAKGGVELDRITELALVDSAAGWYRPEIGRPPGDWTIDEVGRARAKALERMANSRTGLHFIKTHNARISDRYGPLIPREHTAAAIYLLRNPLDVAISYSHHLGWSIEETIALMNHPGAGTPNTSTNVFQLLRSWSQHVESWIAGAMPRPHILRYEDMLENPEGSFGAVLRFLGLQPPPERLARAIELCRFEALRQREDRHGFKERSGFAQRFFREGRAGQWRDILSEGQIRRIVDAHRGAMERFGYLGAERNGT